MLSPEQLQARKKYIGSSDMSAILGLSPFASAEDVRLEKSGRLEDWKGNEATEAGIWLEPVVLEWAMHKLETHLITDHMYVHANGIMCANLDGETGDGYPVEAKTSGIVGPIMGNWGTPGTDEVPEQYVVQVTHQLACHPKKPTRGYVAVLLGGRGFCLYQIERSEELIQAIEERACTFWNEYVLKDRPAPNSMASLEVARRIKRQPGLIAPVSEEVCDEVIVAIAARKQAQEFEEQAKAKLLVMINGADAIRRGMEGPIIADYKPNKNGIRSLKFKNESKGMVAA